MASEGSGDDHGEGDTRGERLIPQLRARRTTGAALVGTLRGDAQRSRHHPSVWLCACAFACACVGRGCVSERVYPVFLVTPVGRQSRDWLTAQTRCCISPDVCVSSVCIEVTWPIVSRCGETVRREMIQCRCRSMILGVTAAAALAAAGWLNGNDLPASSHHL